MAGFKGPDTGTRIIDGLQRLQVEVVTTPNLSAKERVERLKIGVLTLEALGKTEQLRDKRFMVFGTMALGIDMDRPPEDRVLFKDIAFEGTLEAFDHLFYPHPPVAVDSLVVNFGNPILLDTDSERVERASRMALQVPILGISSCIPA